MSDFRIKPPEVPSQAQATGPEGVGAASGAGGAEKPFELGVEPGQGAAGVSGSAAIGPAALVQQIREGKLDVDQAVELLIDQALEARPLPSEALRREVRQALADLVRDDPTLAALASAMRR